MRLFHAGGDRPDGQALALTSDARQRFERGVDPAFLDDGLAIATFLVLEYCGGTASGVTRAGEAPLGTRTYAYDPARTETLAGWRCRRSGSARSSNRSVSRSATTGR